MPATTLAELATALGQHVGVIRQTAAVSPPGGGPAWDALLHHYGVAGVDASERSAVVGFLRLTRGAVPGEFRVLMQAAASWARAELERLARASSLANGAEWRSLSASVEALVDTESAEYERFLGVVPPVPLPAVSAPPAAPATPSLASIFHNAHETAKEVPWAGMQYKAVVTLTCVHCGGPQEQPSDFICRYCRRPIAGSIKANT